MKKQRVTDALRLDWLSDNRAEIEYVTGKVGPGWVREAGWRVFATNRPKGSGDTLRQAIGAAMSREQDDSTA